MMPAVAAVAVLLFFGGIFACVAGWRGQPITSRQRPVVRQPVDRSRIRRMAIALGSGVVVVVLTRWVGLLVAVPGVCYGMLGLYSDRAERIARRERVQAVASWLEMIRDTIASGAGFGSAVRLTAARAPRPIADEVRRLSARLDTMSFSSAISRFGDEVDVAEADTAIVALATASRAAGGNLARVLTVGVESLRSRVEQTSRIDALRARFLTSAGLMVGATAASSTMVLLSSAQFRQAYDSPVGQLVLVMVGGMFVLAVNVLRRMGAMRHAIRLDLAAVQ